MTAVLGGDSANGWWTDAHQVESEVRGVFLPSPGGPPAHPSSDPQVSRGAQGIGSRALPKATP